MNTVELNNNPFNTIDNGDDWLGKKPSPNHFIAFTAIHFAVRCFFIVLRSYNEKYGRKTVEDIIKAYCPDSDPRNDTETYINNVCKWTGFGRAQELPKTKTVYVLLAKAVAKQENSYVLSEEDIAKGMALFCQRFPGYLK